MTKIVTRARMSETGLTKWLHSPLLLAVWNPKKDEVARFLIAGGIPTTRVKDESAREEWFTSRVWKSALRASFVGKNWARASTATVAASAASATAPSLPIKVVHNMHVYPEDNLMELREKIYVATGIPLYRQHIFIIDSQSDKTAVPYSIFTDSPLHVDIRETLVATVATKNMSSASEHSMVHGLPIDKSLYAARDYAHITAGETFTLMSQWMPSGGVIWVVDLLSYTTPIATQLASYRNDKYMIDLIYWGFVVKYWPIMTHEVFAMFVTGEHNIRAAFPAVARNISDIQRKHDAEREIVNARYALVQKTKTMQKYTSITQFTATVTSISVHVNVRNIFEMSRVSAEVPLIIAYVDIGDGHSVRLVRSVFDAPPIEPPSSPAFTNGIIYAIQIQRRTRAMPEKTGGAVSPLTAGIMWLAVHANGKYYVRSTWSEEAGIDFADIYGLLEQYVSPMISRINDMGDLVFNTGNALEGISRETVSFQGLNVSVSWKQPMTTDTFRVLRNSWDAYTMADIAVVRPANLHDRVELTFRKGIYANDPAKIGYVMSMAGIELYNMYSYLSSPFIAKKWAQNYGGRTCSISMRESDVRIDVVDIREDEFRGAFLDYMFAHLWQVTHSDEFVNASSGVSTAGRLVRRLRDTDPELFNMTRYGISRKYSQICQGPKQPMIVEDVSQLSAKNAKKVVKYWNFTRSQPANYLCPDPKYPYLSFITKKHPMGYCLPCCNKRNREDESRATCMREHKWTGDEDDIASEHVMAYGKLIPAGRYSQAHSGVTALFASGGINVLLAAVADSGPENMTVPEWRMVHAIASALELSVTKVMKDISRVIDERYASFGESVAGRDKVSLQRELTNGPRAPGVDWIEIISTSVNIAYSVSVIVFDDTSASSASADAPADKLATNIRIRVPQSTIDSDTAAGKERFILINVTRAHAYPLVYRNGEANGARDTSQDDNSPIRYFTSDIPQIRAIMSDARKSSTRHMDIAAVRRITGWKIIKKYVNLQNLCYAVLLENEGGNDTVYLPITYSNNSTDGIPIDTAGVTDVDIAAFGIQNTIAVLHALGNDVVIAGIARYPRANGTHGHALIVHADQATLYCYVHIDHIPPYRGDSASNSGDLPIVELTYDPAQITRLILARKRANPSHDALIVREQYKMSVYNALVMHIGEQLKHERNDVMRERVIAAARNPEDLMNLDVVMPIDGKLKVYGKLSATDMGIIRATLQFTGIKGLVKRLNAPFDFDMITLTRIQSAATRNDAIAIIREIAKNVTAKSVKFQQQDHHRAFPNIYTTCSSDNTQVFCHGDKLIVDDLEALLPILADDLRNPLRAATIFSEAWHNNIMDRMQFTKYGNERVLVN